jgi:archaellum component FlaF (FlaF/FlaG flagellin family)
LLNYCPSSLLAGQSCVLAVSFYAGNVGSLSGTITVTDNAPGSPQQVGLTATVINPLISLKPSSLSFGTIKVNSHSTAQTVTLTNTGTTALNITSISVTGTNAHDFAETNACASSLAPSAFCTISVTFTPLARGSRFANLTIVDNVQGGTQNVSLSGTGD